MNPKPAAEFARRPTSRAASSGTRNITTPATVENRTNPATMEGIRYYRLPSRAKFDPATNPQAPTPNRTDTAAICQGVHGRTSCGACPVSRPGDGGRPVAPHSSHALYRMRELSCRGPTSRRRAHRVQQVIAVLMLITPFAFVAQIPAPRLSSAAGSRDTMASRRPVARATQRPNQRTSEWIMGNSLAKKVWVSDSADLTGRGAET
jgi:hypothetical protein